MRFRRPARSVTSTSRPSSNRDEGRDKRMHRHINCAAHTLGSIRGMTFAAEIVGAALGPSPFGIVYDALGSYDVAILGLVVLPVVATGAVLLATPPRPFVDRSVPS